MSLSNKNCFNCAERFSRANCLSDRSQISASNSCKRALDAWARNEAAEVCDSSLLLVNLVHLARLDDSTGSTSWRLVTTWNETKNIPCQSSFDSEMSWRKDRAYLQCSTHCSTAGADRIVQFFAQVDASPTLKRRNCVIQIVIDGSQLLLAGANAIQRCLNLHIWGHDIDDGERKKKQNEHLNWERNYIWIKIYIKYICICIVQIPYTLLLGLIWYLYLHKIWMLLSKVYLFHFNV